MNKIFKVIVLLVIMVFLIGCGIQDSFIENSVSSGEHEDVDNLPENAQVDFDANIEIDVNSEKLEVSGEVMNSSNEKESKIDDDIKIEVIPVSGTNLSNTTNAWGFVRKKDGVQPEFSSKYTKSLDDYEGIYVGNKDTKNIYLTFDEGYENGYTGAILDTLKEKEVPAVFFVTMPYVKQNPDLIKRMIDEGHIVGNQFPMSTMYLL